MSLQQQLKTDLMMAMKTKDEDRKTALRIVMGELGRQDAKQVEDDTIFEVIRKLIKSERETLEQSGASGPSAYMTILSGYLPAQASGEEIREWILANVDFSQYRDKMQAMGPIMKHFGSKADGNAVRQILQQLGD